LGSDILTRDRLIRRLEYPRPLTLVVAPAGYGKTTLVADWLRRTGHQHVWFGLRSTDSSLAAFMSGLLQLLEAAFPGACHKSHVLLNSATDVTPADLAGQLMADLAQLARPFWLVLDDYHRIRDENTLKLLWESLQNQPSTLGLVLISRHEPPLLLPDMRARNMVTEVRAQELRFSQDEVAQYFDLAVDAELDDGQLVAINNATEGWPAGLRMVSLAYQQNLRTAVASMSVELGSRQAIEYLANEVLASLPPAHLQFLMRTSILEQVCPSLAAALLDEATPAACQEILEAMARSQLFVTEFGSAGWYRFHHLLLDLMVGRAKAELGAQGIALLHARAARWLADDGQIQPAIGHAVLSGDVRLLASIVGEHRYPVLARGEWANLTAWQALIPPQILARHPQLMMLPAWAAAIRSIPDEVFRQILAVEAVLSRVSIDEQEEVELRAELDALRTMAHCRRGQLEEALEDAQRALAALPEHNVRARGYACIYGAGALELMARTDESDALMAGCIRDAQAGSHPEFAGYVLVATCYAHWMRAEMHRLEAHSRQTIEMVKATSHPEAAYLFHAYLGSALYEMNDLHSARSELTLALEAPYSLPRMAYANGMTALAATHHALGEFGEARAVALRGLRLCQEIGQPHAAELIATFLATLCARQGQMDEVERWLATPMRAPIKAPMTWFKSASLCRIEALLALGTDAAAAEAAEVLPQVRAQVERYPSRTPHITVLALDALHLWRMGDEVQALDALEQSVELTAHGDAIRLLADLDYLIGPLLDRLSGQGRHRTQVTRIRRAALHFAPTVAPVPAPRVASENGATAATPAGPARNGSSPVESQPRVLTLEEALTPRELEVLQMLLQQDRPTNQEIARQLNISIETVKRHMNHIFQKLRVENRRQALVEARRLGILPPG
jgi:LuxR family maltose regulon positive regulatory protein